MTSIVKKCWAIAVMAYVDEPIMFAKSMFKRTPPFLRSKRVATIATDVTFRGK